MTNVEYSQKIQKVIQGIEMICNAMNILEDEIDISIFEKSKFILKTEYEYLPNFEEIQNEFTNNKIIHKEIKKPKKIEYLTTLQASIILNTTDRTIRRKVGKIDAKFNRYIKKQGKAILIDNRLVYGNFERLAEI